MQLRDSSRVDEEEGTRYENDTLFVSLAIHISCFRTSYLVPRTSYLLYVPTPSRLELMKQADVAQLVEQSIRNRQVIGSSPIVGAISSSCDHSKVFLQSKRAQ